MPSPVNAPMKVVLADDHPIWRDGVRADLGDGFAVVAEAGTADEAIEAIRRTEPDLVVCDSTCQVAVGSRWCGPAGNRPAS